MKNTGPWVILLTDRRGLGRPLRLVSRQGPASATENINSRRRFGTEKEARGWWRELLPPRGSDPEDPRIKRRNRMVSRFLPTFTTLEADHDDP